MTKEFNSVQKKVYSHEKHYPNTKKLNNIALIELMSDLKPEVESSYYTINGIFLPKELKFG